MGKHLQGVYYILEIIRPKWAVEMLVILLDGAKRFNGIKASIQGITAATLSKNLALLEQTGIIYRKEYPAFPRRVEYALTERGKELMTLLQYLDEWGVRYQSEYDPNAENLHKISLGFIQGCVKTVSNPTKSERKP